MILGYRRLLILVGVISFMLGFLSGLGVAKFFKEYKIIPMIYSTK